MEDPNSFIDLYVWISGALSRFEDSVDSPFVLPSEVDGRCCSAPDVWLWLFQQETPYAEAIATAAERFWMHEEEAFRDLPPQAAKLLRLRIATAAQLIEEFCSTEEECPIPFPTGEYRELMEWLLIAWWKSKGSHRAAQRLWAMMKGF